MTQTPFFIEFNVIFDVSSEPSTKAQMFNIDRTKSQLNISSWYRNCHNDIYYEICIPYYMNRLSRCIKFYDVIFCCALYFVHKLVCNGEKILYKTHLRR